MSETREPPAAGGDEQPSEERAQNLAAAAASAYVNAGSWALAQSLRASRRVARAVVNAPEQVADAATSAAAHASNPARTAKLSGEELLRRAGENLLRRSRELDEDVSIHPAYERILTELSPDEGRVLRLLFLGGPQPSVDVRAGGLFGFFNTRIISQRLTMVGARAGLRHRDHVPAYLNNLLRLGMIWFSPETIRDHQRYQVLEAQPEVAEAMHAVRYARVVRRSIHLTPFGEDFCNTCLAGETYGHQAATASGPPPPA